MAYIALNFSFEGDENEVRDVLKNVEAQFNIKFECDFTKKVSLLGDTRFFLGEANSESNCIISGDRKNIEEYLNSVWEDSSEAEHFINQIKL
jgi:hypothetical protein